MRRRRLVRAGERVRVRVDGAAVTFRAYGAGSPLVVVHGLLGSSRWWSRNVAVLASRFKVLLVEQIAYRSGGLPLASAYLDRWMTYLDIGPASLMGHSMGGYIVARFAAEPAALPEFERALKLDEGVIRYLITLHEHDLGAPPMTEEELAAAKKRADDDDDDEE